MAHQLLTTALVVAACGGGGTSHVPVDPSLDLAIVVPATMKRFEADFVFVERAPAGMDGAAWAATLRASNQSYTVAEPTRDGDGWVTSMTSRNKDFNDLRTWYRTLGGELAITCTPITAFHAPTPAELESSRATCFGTQRVAGGIYVPFRFSTTEKHTNVELALVGEPLNWHVDLERAADAPKWRFDPKGAGGGQKEIDRGTVSGGTWWLSGGPTRVAGMHYDVVAHRTIGGLDLACYGDTYHSAEYARRQLDLCLKLEAP